MVRPNVIYSGGQSRRVQPSSAHRLHSLTSGGDNMDDDVRIRHVARARQSDLFCMVWNRSWEELLRRATAPTSRPNELDLQDDSTGNTLLHEACRLDPPPDVIRAMKGSCRIQNHQGATPFHIAASHRISAEALRVLLDCAAAADNNGGAAAAAESASPFHHLHHHQQTSPTADLSNKGRAPIHYACMSFRGLDIDAFLLLLDETLKHGNLVVQNDDTLYDLDEFSDDEDEEMYKDYQLPDDKGTDENNYFDGQQQQQTVNVMSLKDALGMTPLALLFRRYRQRVRSVISTVDRLNNESPRQAALASALMVRAELGELWEKARRIVARLTQERLIREGRQAESETQQESLSQEGVRSPAEAAVKQEAAAWAAEKYGKGSPPDEGRDDVLPVYVEAADRDRSLSPVPKVGGGGDGGVRSSRTGNCSASDTDEEKLDSSSPESMAGRCRQFRIVHASVGLIGYGCPPEMIRLAISIHPHQVREMDEDGNLPLHIAVKASSYLTETAECNQMAAAAAMAASNGSSAADDLSVLSDAMSFFSTATISQTPNPFDKVIKILLQHYPEGARIPHGQTGELPLVTAIQSGYRTWDDGIRTLLNAYPPALHNKKLMDPGLYPIVLALVSTVSLNDDVDEGGNDGGNTHNNHHKSSLHRFSRSKRRRHDDCARTTLFELLRTKPEWLTPEGRRQDDETS